MKLILPDNRRKYVTRRNYYARRRVTIDINYYIINNDCKYSCN